MNIFRNPELRRLLFVLLPIALGGLVCAFLVSPLAAVVFGAFSLALIVCVIVFTCWRYRKIAALTQALRRINSGDFSLNISEYDEGELALLGSELYKTTVMLRTQNEALEQDKQALAEALSDISHQLKTPLTSIFMMTDLLCDNEMPTERRAAFTAKIRTQIERLQWLVASLLKLSKLDAKSIEFHKRPVLASALIEQACAPLLILMELKEQTLQVQAGDIELLCDEKWTAEALLNIIKNCVEHTPQGGKITITCTKNPFYTRITVCDNGEGIAKEDLPYIFTRFYKGKNAGEDSVGIGLAMAYTIIEAQGGALSVKSQIGQGSTFLIQI